MKRTISAMRGPGSLNHNRRSFTAENVDPKRSSLNVVYRDEPIQKVYHELFDEALARYNAKQTRADRKIKDYYEKIRASKQEKTFHEIILQVGNKDDMHTGSDEGELAWVAKKDVSALRLWDGDRIFLKLLIERDTFFSLKLSYDGDELIETELDGVKITYK